jgi:erythromycin esterase
VQTGRFEQQLASVEVQYGRLIPPVAPVHFSFEKNEMNTGAKQKSILLLCILSGAVVLGARAQKNNHPPAFIKPIQTVSPGAAGNTGDVNVLLKWAANKKYIGLGEITHGTREIVEFKTRLVQFFVQKMGAKVLIMEVNMAECYPINEYITRGVGNPEQLLKNTGITTMMYGEYVNLLVWLKQYNEKQTAANKVRLWGYDIQAPQTAAAWVLGFLEKNSMADTAPGAATFKKIAASGKSVQQINPALAPAFKAGTDSLIQYCNTSRNLLQRNNSAEEVYFFSRLLNSMRQSWQLFSAKSIAQAYFMRDSLNYANIIELGTGSRTPVLIWAHNGHIKKYDFDYPEFNTIGKLMQDYNSREYYSIGSLFFEGAVFAINSGSKKYETITLPAADSASAESFFSKQYPGNFLLNVALAAKNKKWSNILTEKVPARSIGNTYDTKNAGKNYARYVFAKQFDAVFFIRQSSAPSLLPAK